MEKLLRKNDIIKLNIQDVTIDGYGVGKFEGIAVFVPHTAIGDVIKAKIIKVKSSYLVGKIEEILVPSQDRVNSDCPVSGKCGGCAFRHISYSAELKIKQKHVTDCLERIGGFKQIPVQDIVGAKNILHYRNKAQVPIGINSEGDLISGFYGNHSHRIINQSECLLQPKVFDEIIEQIKIFIKKYKISVYDENTHKGLVRHIYLRRSKNSEEIMVCLVINGASLPFAEEIASKLTDKFKQIKGFLINSNTKKTNVILGETTKTIFGSPVLKDELCGLDFKISPKSFYQVNHDQTEVLYDLGRRILKPDKNYKILDLYCGIGTIGLSMAKYIKNLFGVEIVPEAVENAKENAKINKIDNAEFFCGDSGKVLSKHFKKFGSLDAVIIDPPRKGCTEELIADLIKISPPKILYISCNPATLAKDLKKICESTNYVISSVTPVDLFPRTGHVETVVCLSREEAAITSALP